MELYNFIAQTKHESSFNSYHIPLNSVITDHYFRGRHQASRILRTTHLLIRCFLFFDICYLLSGISLIVMALTEQFANKEKMILFGGLFGVFASVSALCNRSRDRDSRTFSRMTTFLQFSQSRCEDMEERIPAPLAGILHHGHGLPTHGAGPLSL